MGLSPVFPPDLQLTENIVYSTLGLKLDLLVQRNASPAPRPAIVHIHGGGWEMYSKWPVANVFLAQAGFVTVSIDYRLSPEHRFPAHIEDAKTAVRWLRAHAGELQVDPHRIGVWGISAGGHLAALLGTTAGQRDLEGLQGGWQEQTSAVQAVASICGVTDFLDPGFPMNTQNLFGKPLQEARDLARMASPVCHVDDRTAPFLHVHGREDGLVPLSQAERLHQRLLQAGVPSELQVLEGDHFINDTHQHEMEQHVLRFFRQALNFA